MSLAPGMLFMTPKPIADSTREKVVLEEASPYRTWGFTFANRGSGYKRVVTAIHDDGSLIYGLDRPYRFDPAASTVTQFRSPEENSMGSGLFFAGSEYSSSMDSVRDHDFIYTIERQNNSNYVQPPRLNVRRLDIRTGAWHSTIIMLPRHHGYRRLGIFGVMYNYLLVCMWNPFVIYAIPIDRLNRVHDAKEIPQLSWLVNGLTSFLSLSTDANDKFLLRGFKRPNNRGMPRWMAMLSTGTSSVVAVIDFERRDVTLRFAPDMRYNMSAWVNATDAVQTVGRSAGCQLALDDDGYLTYLTSPSVLAVVDLKVGYSEAFVLNRPADVAIDAIFGRHLFASIVIDTARPYSPGGVTVPRSTFHFTDLHTEEKFSVNTDLPMYLFIGSYNYIFPYLLYDDCGHIWGVSPAQASSSEIAPYYMHYFGSYMDLGVRSAGKRLGFAHNMWKTSWVNELPDNDRTVRTHLIKEAATAANPFDAADAVDGSVMSVVNSQPRLVHPDGFTPARLPDFDPELDVGKVLGSAGSEYAWVRNPTPVPDWFNGCTPVFDPVKKMWRAGDALIDLPRVRRDNVTFVSKNKRWEPRVLSDLTLWGSNRPTFIKVTNSAAGSNNWQINDLRDVNVMELPQPVYIDIRSGSSTSASMYYVYINTKDLGNVSFYNSPPFQMRLGASNRFVADFAARTLTPADYIVSDLGDVFSSVTPDRPCYPMYVSAAYRPWATDYFPAATGQKQGFLWGAPTESGDCKGTDRETIGICGALNNFWWEGADDTSNRRFSNFWPVVNTGTGRHEVGDMLFTTNRSMDSYSDCWHNMSGFSVVCRINNWEPGCLYGDEHKELYWMWARWMARQWMRGAVTYAVPIRFECEISDTDDFSSILAQFDTANDVVGWQFEHTDGGQSTFLPTGPTANTVKGVVFDPRHAGFPFDRTLHFFRWRKYVNNSATPTEWAPAMMTNIETDWRRMALVEDQRFVNHVVVPDLGERPFNSTAVQKWLFSKKPSTPVGGHSIFIPALPGETRPTLVEIQVGDGVWFKKHESSSYQTDPDAWSIINSNGDLQPYPYNMEFDSGINGIMFDPIAAGFESRVGTRFVRYRYVVDGTAGRWRTTSTITTESSLLRTDNLNVVAMAYERVPTDDNEPIVSNEQDVADLESANVIKQEFTENLARVGRIPHSDVTVFAEALLPNRLGLETRSAAVDRADVVHEGIKLDGRVSGDVAGGKVLVLSHGLYDVIRDDDKYDVIWKMHNKRRDQLELPPMFENNLSQVVKRWRSRATEMDNYNQYFMGDTFPMGSFARVSSTCAAYEHVPGSSIVSRITPNFDVNPQMYSYGKQSDFSDETKSPMSPVLLTGMSPDRRFLSLRGLGEDRAQSVGRYEQKWAGYVFDFILGVPHRVEPQFALTYRSIPMCVDGELFVDPSNENYPQAVRLYEPRSGLFVRLPDIETWKDYPLDVEKIRERPERRNIFADQAEGNVFSVLEYHRELKALRVSQRFGQARNYLFRRGSDKFIVTRVSKRDDKYYNCAFDDLTFYTPAEIAPTVELGSSKVMTYIYNTDYYRTNHSMLRYGTGVMSFIYPNATGTFGYTTRDTSFYTFPMYSGMYMRATMLNGRDNYLQNVRLPGARLVQVAGSKNVYDRLDTGVSDFMVGGCKPFIPVRDITSTNMYSYATAMTLGDTNVMSPQGFGAGVLVVNTMVGEAVFTDGMAAEGFCDLEVWQRRGR